MDQSMNELKAGDIVEVLRPSEILSTLNSDGATDSIPFMPEMMKYCGRKFKISRRVNRSCVTCMDPDYALRIGEFSGDDVYFLDGLRCDGLDHGGCDRGCMIFWRSAWLRKASVGVADEPPASTTGVEELAKALKVQEKDGLYFCQSTRLVNAVTFISKGERARKAYQDLGMGVSSGIEGAKAIVMPLIRSAAGKLKRPARDVKAPQTPTETLGLMPGDLVEVKSFREIQSTLDSLGRNRGLTFITDMKQYCGKRFRVKSRMEKTILEHTGRMIEMKNTVMLEGNTCRYDHLFGGCPRNEYNYWREIWLRRVAE